MSNRRILFYELAGIIFIILFGSLLHFTFEWSGRQIAVGVFSAVNESVWEHLKLGFWSAIAFALFEFSQLRRVANNFLLAKAVGIYLIPTVIVVIFYSYTAIIGESLLAVDILTFIIAVILGQAASYKLMMWKPLPAKLNVFSIVALLLLGAAFLLFTFNPPRLPLFQDPVTGGYGIINH